MPDSLPLRPLQSAPLRARSTPRLSYYLHRPRRLVPGRPALVAVHGISRNALRQLEVFQDFAERDGRLLIAPLFCKERFQGYQRLKPGRAAADRALLALLEELREECGAPLRQVDLFGFSGGAQFAHRFALFHPQRVRRLVLAAAGWYSFPTFNAPYPYGLATRRRTGRDAGKALAEFLAIPKLLLVGEQDRARDASLRINPDIDIRQGFDRVERAQRWAAALEAAGRRLGAPAPLRLSLLAGCGHDFDDCVALGGLACQTADWLTLDHRISEGENRQ